MKLSRKQPYVARELSARFDPAGKLAEVRVVYGNAPGSKGIDELLTEWKKQAGAPEVHGIDLKVAPVERAVGIVVVDLALPTRVFGPLNGQCNPARGSELITGVLLEGGEPVAKLIGLGCPRFLGKHSRSNHQRRLQPDTDR